MVFGGISLFPLDNQNLNRTSTDFDLLAKRMFQAVEVVDNCFEIAFSIELKAKEEGVFLVFRLGGFVIEGPYRVLAVGGYESLDIPKAAIVEYHFPEFLLDGAPNPKRHTY